MSGINWLPVHFQWCTECGHGGQVDKYWDKCPSCGHVEDPIDLVVTDVNKSRGTVTFDRKVPDG